jgi:phage repressor protein C with HTH and peptisase S24 domain
MISVLKGDNLDSMDQTMSDRLRLARENAGFSSARSAALAIGVNPSTYGAHENGQNNFKPKDADFYARAFGVSAAWLLTGIPLVEEDLNAGYGLDRPINIDIEHNIPESYASLKEQGTEPLRPGRTFADGARGQKIAEIDLVAGMGGGGLATTEVSSNNGITFHSEVVRAHWEMPSWVLNKMNVRAHSVACFPCQGDSMTPTISDGDVIFIDTRHRVPSPPGIYAIADEFGGVVVKRLEVISKPRDEEVMVRVSSDNPHYRDKELLLNEISILGRYICRVAF